MKAYSEHGVGDEKGGSEHKFQIDVNRKEWPYFCVLTLVILICLVQDYDPMRGWRCMMATLYMCREIGTTSILILLVFL